MTHMDKELESLLRETNGDESQQFDDGKTVIRWNGKMITFVVLGIIFLIILSIFTGCAVVPVKRQYKPQILCILKDDSLIAYREGSSISDGIKPSENSPVLYEFINSEFCDKHPTKMYVVADTIQEAADRYIRVIHHCTAMNIRRVQ